MGAGGGCVEAKWGSAPEPAALDALWVGAPASVEASTLPPPGLRRWECGEFF